MHRKEEKKTPSDEHPVARNKEPTGKTDDSISSVWGLYDPGHQDTNIALTRTIGNTYQLGPYKRFRISAVTEILKDALTTNLQLEKYEAEWAKQMTKTLTEVIKARVKDLMIPRYKIVVWITIGQLAGQSMQISSRCVWDANTDTYVSYSFKNNSLYATALVFLVYFE